MDRLKMPDGEAIEAGIVTRSIESAQRKVEARNFDIRKQLLEYDDVANDQRKVIYQQRNDILEAADAGRADRQPARRRDDRRGAHLRAGRERRGAVGPAGPGEGAARGVAARASTCRARSRRATAITDEDIVEKVVAGGRRSCSTARSTLVGERAVHAVHAHGAAAVDRLALARAPGRARLPAPGHPPARLCAEEPEAGIQARGVRAVRAAARLGQDGGHAHADDGAHPVARSRSAQAAEAIEERASQVGQRDLHRIPTKTGEAEVRSTRRPHRSGTGGSGRPTRCLGDRVGRNDPCPCGSGKKYKQCHGKLA